MDFGTERLDGQAGKPKKPSWARNMAMGDSGVAVELFVPMVFA